MSTGRTHERQTLGQQCFHITRPALANYRMQINCAGQVVFKLTMSWRNGTAHIVIPPPDFMQSMTALAAPARQNSVG